MCSHNRKRNHHTTMYFSSFSSHKCFPMTSHPARQLHGKWHISITSLGCSHNLVDSVHGVYKVSNVSNASHHYLVVFEIHSSDARVSNINFYALLEVFLRLQGCQHIRVVNTDNILFFWHHSIFSSDGYTSVMFVQCFPSLVPWSLKSMKHFHLGLQAQ